MRGRALRQLFSESQRRILLMLGEAAVFGLLLVFDSRQPRLS